MHILIYEFITAGGWHTIEEGPPPASLAQEGAAMLTALAADFCRLPGVAVSVLRDARPADAEFPGCHILSVSDAQQERERLMESAAEADWTVVIAPEFSGLLLERCRWVLAAGGRLLGPGESLVELAADKHATVEHLRSHGLRVPEGLALPAGQPPPPGFPCPAVLKPRDGAGSQLVRLLERPLPEGQSWPALSMPARIERFCPGLAASVAWLCGSGGDYPLPPCRQHLADDGTFAYLGGSLPLPVDLAERAIALTRRAVATLPGRLGYLGIDLVLGDDPTGAADVVIEVNPRLTTSYIGLRAAAHTNLAAALLAVAQGQPCELSFRASQITFAADGVLLPRLN